MRVYAQAALEAFECSCRRTRPEIEGTDTDHRRRFTNCPVCGLALESIERIVDQDAFYISCPRCGHYAIVGTLLGTGFPSAPAAQRAGLMAALRDASDRKTERRLTSDNWEQLASQFSNYSIAQKLRRLLEHIGSASEGHAGASIFIDNDHDFPKVAARDGSELQWLKKALAAQRLLEIGSQGVILTLAGWEAYRPMRGGAPGTCFVAMAFDGTLDLAYSEGIQPAVETDCRFTVVRVDRVEHNDNINDRIIGEILSCQFLVADFTFHRNGVYFEAGFASGLGRPVIWTCRRDQMRGAHFDTRPYNHVLWEQPAELHEKLANRIRSTVQR